ncbi:MAG: hypothetical protein RLZZ283_577 [Candidatus Parcubacteria bacterium]|jgi:hypothetical protein
MEDYKTYVAIASIIIGVVAYIPYYRDVFKGNTKPHLYSWIIWGLLQGIAFFAQVATGAGVGAWLTGVGALQAFSIVGLSFFYGEKGITRLDTFSLIGAFIGIAVWIVTDNPLYALIIAVVVDSIGYIPTFRKSYAKPKEETLSFWAAVTFVYFFNMLALESYNLTTVLQPIVLGLVSGALLIWLIVRRLQLKGSTI